MIDQPIPSRTCATCCAYDTAAEWPCWNQVSIQHSTDRTGSFEAPQPTDCCDDHKTRDEDRSEDAAVACFFVAIGVQPRGSTE